MLVCSRKGLISKKIRTGNDLGCAPGAILNYDSEGNCFGSIMEVPPKARKLRWEVPEECQNLLQKCLKVGS